MRIIACMFAAIAIMAWIPEVEARKDLLPTTVHTVDPKAEFPEIYKIADKYHVSPEAITLFNLDALERASRSGCPSGLSGQSPESIRAQAICWQVSFKSLTYFLDRVEKLYIPAGPVPASIKEIVDRLPKEKKFGRIGVDIILDMDLAPWYAEQVAGWYVEAVERDPNRFVGTVWMTSIFGQISQVSTNAIVTDPDNTSQTADDLLHRVVPPTSRGWISSAPDAIIWITNAGQKADIDRHLMMVLPPVYVHCLYEPGYAHNYEGKTCERSNLQRLVDETGGHLVEEKESVGQK